MLVRDAKLLMETQELQKVQKFGRTSDISGSSLFKEEYFASDLDQKGGGEVDGPLPQFHRP